MKLTVRKQKLCCSLRSLAGASRFPFFGAFGRRVVQTFLSNIFLSPQSVSCTKKSSVGGSIREIAAGVQNKDSTRLHGSQREGTHESMIKDFSEKVVCKTRQHPPPWLFTEAELGRAYMIKDLLGKSLAAR